MERSKPFFDGEVDLFADFPEPEDKVEVDPATDFKPEDFDFKEEPAEEIDFDAEPDNYFEVSFTTPEGQEIVAATSDGDTAGQLSHVETPLDLLNALISELGLEDQVEIVEVKEDEEKSEEAAEETEESEEDEEAAEADEADVSAEEENAEEAAEEAAEDSADALADEECEGEECEEKVEEELCTECGKPVNECTCNECDNKNLTESQSQELSKIYTLLKDRFMSQTGKTLEELVYGPDGFMATNYPDGFPDFAGDLVYSEKYWHEFTNWLNNKFGSDDPKVEVVESQIDDFDTQIQSDELAELSGAVDTDITPEELAGGEEVDEGSPLSPEEEQEILDLFDESLNNSEALKDAEKHSDLKTENESENLTLNEAVHDPDEIDWWEEDIKDAIRLLARRGKAEFWCLNNKPDKAEEVVKRFKEKFGKDVVYNIEDELCTAKVVKEQTEDYTGTPEIRTTHLEYEDKDVTDGKTVLPDNITKKEDDHCEKINKVINHTPDEQETLKESLSDETVKKMVEDLEENEDEVECKWCNELYPKSDCRKEVHMGWLCPYCRQEIRSRGEPLTFVYGEDDDDFDESLEETTDQDLKDNRQPVPEVSKEMEKPVDETEIRKFEAGITEDVEGKDKVAQDILKILDSWDKE